MEIFIEFLLFVLKAFTIAVLIFVPIFLISLSRKTKEESLGEAILKRNLIYFGIDNLRLF